MLVLGVNPGGFIAVREPIRQTNSKNLAVLFCSDHPRSFSSRPIICDSSGCYDIAMITRVLGWNVIAVARMHNAQQRIQGGLKTPLGHEGGDTIMAINAYFLGKKRACYHSDR